MSALPSPCLAAWQSARLLKQRILEEQRVTSLLDAATRARDIAALRAGEVNHRVQIS